MVKITFISGEGRGKTTTGMGIIFQKQKLGKSILVAQFLKTGKNCGECNFFENNTNIRWYSFGKQKFYRSKDQEEEYKELMKEGLGILFDELKRTETDILLLDELGMVLSFELLSWNQVERIFPYVAEEIILTGRKFPKGLQSKADKCIEVKEIKHPYSKGIEARKGIDF